MAYTAPGTVTAGDVATAAAWNVVVNDVIDVDSRLRVFTTEAVRDAAITSPTEGMIAYLTAPTIPAATGTTTMIPSGIRTVYNGSVWVCVTEVAANTPATGTTTSTSFSATLSGSPGTNPSVTLVTGTTAMVIVKFVGSNNTAGATAACAVAVSGATTLAAGLDETGGSIRSATINNDASICTSMVLSGLTAGTNTFTLQYLCNSNTASINRRALAVHGIA
jgi:hypothetical protein